jgi:hypothetical protein
MGFAIQSTSIKNTHKLSSKLKCFTTQCYFAKLWCLNYNSQNIECVMYKNLGGILKIIKVKIANKTIDAHKIQHFQQKEQLPFKIKIFK